MNFLSVFKKKSITTSAELREELLKAFASTAAGINVTPDKALECTAYFSSAKAIIEALEQLPFILYEENGNSKFRAKRHRLYSILHDSPNEYQTSGEFRQEMMLNCLLYGVAYAYVNRTRSGVTELIPLNPEIVEIKKKEDDSFGFKFILKQSKGRDRELMPDEIFKISSFPGFFVSRTVPNGVKPLKNAIGLSMAAEEFGSLTFSNGAVASGFLKHPQKLGPEAKKNLLKSMQAMMGGENKHKLALLDEGMEFSRVAMNPEEMQSIETRKHQRSEISGGVGVPPHKIGDLDKATFSNIENQSLEFVIYSLLVWCRRWEQAVSKYLLTKEEREKYYAELLVDGLLRGDIDSRSKAYQLFIRNGIMTPNEVRQRENLNPTADEYGDQFFYTADLVPGKNLGKEKQ